MSLPFLQLAVVRGLVAGFALAAPMGPVAMLCVRRTLANFRVRFEPEPDVDDEPTPASAARKVTRPKAPRRSSGGYQLPALSLLAAAAAAAGASGSTLILKLPLDLSLALLSGALLALSFPRYGHPAAAWIALAPLLVELSGWTGRPGPLRGQKPLRAFGLGMAAGADQPVDRHGLGRKRHD